LQVSGHRHWPESTDIAPAGIARWDQPHQRQRSGQQQPWNLAEGLSNEALPERKPEHVTVHAKVLDRGRFGQDMSAFQSPKGEMLIALAFSLEHGGQFCLYVRSDLFGKR
jgi:hypothetical protein